MSVLLRALSQIAAPRSRCGRARPVRVERLGDDPHPLGCQPHSPWLDGPDPRGTPHDRDPAEQRIPIVVRSMPWFLSVCTPEEPNADGRVVRGLIVGTMAAWVNGTAVPP